MSDYFLRLNSENRGNTNPITQAGRIVFNFYKDDGEIKKRQDDKTEELATYFPGPVDDQNLSILEGEIVYQILENEMDSKHGLAAEPSSVTLTALNGGFLRSDKPWQILEQIRVVGVAMGKCEHDSKNENPENVYAVQMGGLVTILNNGNQVIPAGSWVIFDLPSIAPGKALDRKRGGQKWLLVTKPYDISCDLFFSKPDMLRDIMMNERRVFNDDTFEKSYATVTTAQAIKERILTMLPTMLHIAALFGIVQLDPEILKDTGKSERNKRSKNYVTSHGQRQEFMIKLHAMLGLMKCSDGVSYSTMTTEIPQTRNEFGKARPVSLAECAISTFFNDEDYMMIGYEKGTRRPPSGDAGKVFTKQRENWGLLYQTIGEAHHILKNRIFCKSINGAEPGEYMDIMLGKMTL